MRKLIPLIFICLVVFGLASCDIAGEESFDFKPGDSLAIVGPDNLTLPQDSTTVDTTDGTFVRGTYYSKAFTINKEYTWTVSGNAQQDSVYRQGEFMDVIFTETGIYTIAVDDGEYQGSINVTVRLSHD